MSWVRRLVPDPIRRRYVFKFGIVLMMMGVAIGAIGIGATALITEQIEQNVLGEQTAIADSEARTVEGWHQQNEIAIERIAASQPVASGNASRIQTYLDGLPDQLPAEILALHYVDADTETILASSRAPFRTVSIDRLDVESQRDIYLRSTPEVSWVSQPYLTTDEFGNDRPAITYARETLDDPDRVIVYTVALDESVPSFQTASRAEATTIVLDGQNRVLIDDVGHGSGAYGSGDRTFGRRYEGPGVVGDRNNIVIPGAQRVDSPPTGVLASSAYRLPDGPYLVGYAPVRGTDWLVVVHEPLSSAFGFVNTIRWYGTVATLLSILLITVLGSLLGRNAAVAIDRLTEKAKRIEEGDRNVDLSTDRIDEIGTLYVAFDNMRDTLDTQIEELRRINEDLEEQRAITSVLNRLLTHNLRNSLSVVVGYAEQLIDQLEGEQQEAANRINRRAALLSRRIEKSKAVERLVTAEVPDLDPVDVSSIVAATVAEYESQFPDASIETDLPDNLVVRAGDALGFVVENLLENAIEHNDRDRPTVEITADPVEVDGEEWVELRVTDDGPGIPEHELAVLERGEETPLEHGSGLGLWLINWLTDQMGGDLAFADRADRGTVGTVRLPLA